MERELREGDVVIIVATEDWPEHHFRVDSIHDDCIGGIALTGPFAGEYGEPGIELIVGLVTGPLGS